MTSRLDLAKARHDLRTPINHILGYCEMLLDEEDMPERIVEDLRKIHSGGRQLLELIGRYLDEETFGLQDNLQQLQHELRTPVNHIIGYSEILIEQALDLGQKGLAADLERIRTAAQQWLVLMESHLLAPRARPSRTARRAKPGPTRPPRQKDARPPVNPAAEIRPHTSASLLIVDDDAPSRELLARRLHRLGFTVTTAADGTTALNLVHEHRFDLVLLDFMMPDINGLDVLRRIRSEKSMTDLPVIMVTGRDASDDVVWALKYGANDYLTKPVDFSVALARLGTDLQLRQTQAELRESMDQVRQLADDLKVRNEFIKDIFGRYLSSDIVQSVLETPGGLDLGGQKRVVTILMSDLRGFTGLAEDLPPEKVVTMLNIYLGAMAEVIVKYNGVIDEFIGDAILAIFGAPLPRQDHAESAVACALAMQIEMERVNRRLGHLGISALEMGIGINTGEVIVGNIGSEKRAKYGVVGANVNLAGRIQSATVGGEILVSESTALQIGEGLETEGTISFHPKGMTSPITLHCASGLRGRDHLKLPHPPPTAPQFTGPIPVQCSRLTDNKTLAADSFDGELRCLSPRHGTLKTSTPLACRIDLVLKRLTDGGGVLYCKVMSALDSDGLFSVRFTSLIWQANGKNT